MISRATKGTVYLDQSAVNVLVLFNQLLVLGEINVVSALETGAASNDSVKGTRLADGLAVNLNVRKLAEGSFGLGRRPSIRSVRIPLEEMSDFFFPLFFFFTLRLNPPFLANQSQVPFLKSPICSAFLITARASRGR